MVSDIFLIFQFFPALHHCEQLATLSPNVMKLSVNSPTSAAKLALSPCQDPEKKSFRQFIEVITISGRD